ncbi:MAG: SDR family oxidoreductase [Acidimicrobiia bacterium]
MTGDAVQRLDGRVAIITGASRGIGHAIATRFVEAGARGIVCNARHHEDLEALRTELPAGVVATVTGSMGDPATATQLVATALAQFGQIDIVVNNAATNPTFGNVLDAEPSAVRKILEVNVEGPLALVREACHAWMHEHGGAVINIASIGGLEPQPFIGVYNVSKAALIHLTRQLAAECAPAVRVNAIAPGLVRTRFARALWESDETSVANMIPLGRIGEPPDIAHAALFLAADTSAWITGTTLIVDGGALLR